MSSDVSVPYKDRSLRINEDIGDTPSEKTPLVEQNTTEEDEQSNTPKNSTKTDENGNDKKEKTKKKKGLKKTTKKPNKNANDDDDDNQDKENTITKNRRTDRRQINNNNNSNSNNNNEATIINSSSNQRQSVNSGNAALGIFKYIVDCVPFVKNNLYFGLGFITAIPDNAGKGDIYDHKAAFGHKLDVVINRISGLGVELGLVKPSVVMHIVNRFTGSYLYSKGNLENASKVISPVKSADCLMKEESTVPTWNNLLNLGVDYTEVVTSNSIFLFELLDTRVSIKSKKEMAEGRHIKRIGWAFLVPEGMKGDTLCVSVKKSWLNVSNESKGKNKFKSNNSNNNVENKNIEDNDDSSLSMKLQLYAYQCDGTLGYLQRGFMGWHKYSGRSFREHANLKLNEKSIILTGPDKAYPDGVPEVYIQWRRQTLKPLLASLKITTRINTRLVVSDMALELASQMDASKLQSDRSLAQHGKNQEEHARLKAAAVMRTRGHIEPCTAPDRLLHRVDVGPEGAMISEFSPTGTYLAVGCCTAGGTTGIAMPYPSLLYGLKLIDCDLGTIEWSSESVHHGPIYRIRWTKNGNFIMTCSGDGTCRVWSVQTIKVKNPVKKNSVSMSPRRRSTSEADEEELVSKLSLKPLCIMRHSPAAFVYTCLFQEFSKGVTSTHTTRLFSSTDASVVADSKTDTTTDATSDQEIPLPRVLTGSHDGHIRVWKGATMIGRLSITESGPEVNLDTIGNLGKLIDDKNSNAKEVADSPPSFEVLKPHLSAINDMTFDERTRYLISGDATGNILLWRMDADGWYQRLRQFKKDDLPGHEILSLTMHPDKSRGLLLVLAKPDILRVYSMSSYRVQSTYAGVACDLPGINRANFSVDGAYVCCGSEKDSGNAGGSQSATGNRPHSTLRLWDMINGQEQDSDLLKLEIPHAFRSVNWHPKQQMVVATLQGINAPLLIYVSNTRESHDVTMRRRNTMALAAFSNPIDEVDGGDGTDLNVTLKSGISNNSNLNTSGQFSAPKSILNNSLSSNVTFGASTTATTALSVLGAGSLNADTSRSEKARAMVERIRALRANANANANGTTSASASVTVVPGASISSTISNASAHRGDLSTAQVKTLPLINSSGSRSID